MRLFAVVGCFLALSMLAACEDAEERAPRARASSNSEEWEIRPGSGHEGSDGISDPDGKLTLGSYSATAGEVVSIDIDPPKEDFYSEPYVHLERWNGRRWAFQHSLYIIDGAWRLPRRTSTERKQPGPFLSVRLAYEQPAIHIPPVEAGRYRVTMWMVVYPSKERGIVTQISDHLTIE